MTRFILLLLVVIGMARDVEAQRRRPAAPRVVTILHFNDVYEITPVSGGASGGLARVAAVRAALVRTGPALLTTLGGDFLSPSAMGLAVIDGQRLAGRQMVAVLNRVGLDWAALGNHEFDVREGEFLARLAESRFRYLTSNVTDSAGRPFPNTVTRAVVPLRTRGGLLRVGLIGLTIDDNRPPWVRFEDPIAAAAREVAALRDSVDLIVALTHLSLAQDQQLAESVPDLALILGGHEHENYEIRRGPNFTPIVKADANVRTVAVVTLTVPRRGARAMAAIRFVPIDSAVREHPGVAAEVARWVTLTDSAYRAQGLDPRTVVTTLTEPLDGREAVVRTRPGNLTALIAQALRREAGAEVGLMNGGSVRIDDVIPVGSLTQYDVIRILPFGGVATATTMSGALLGRVLDQGEANAGSGGYLHPAGVTRADGRWMVAGQPIDPARAYTVGTTDFLLTGREKGLDYLAPGNPGLGAIRELRDIRMVVIDELKRRFPNR
jgi:5'-nucleotidase/UDP-sugar diphosphatase